MISPSPPSIANVRIVTVDALPCPTHSPVVFTAEQVARYSQLLVHYGVPVPAIERPATSAAEHGIGPQRFQPPQEPLKGASFADLAREFGVEAQLVQALAHRLAALS